LSWLVNWFTQLMLYIVLATMVDLLMPTNRIKQYVAFVLKIFLLSIYLQPLFLLFSVSASQFQGWMDNVFVEEENTYASLEKKLVNETNDIKVRQWYETIEIVEDEWKEFANDQLGLDYPIELTQVSIETDGLSLSMDAIERVVVYYKEKNTSTVIPIKEIGTEDEYDYDSYDEDAIQNVLSSIWDIKGDEIEVIYEGDREQ